MTSNVKGLNSLSLAWLKVIISWSHINFVWIVSKLYMYPSIIMRSCLSFMGKHNIWTKVLESVFFSANPLLNIFTQTLSLKSYKNQFAKCLHVRLFKCSNCMVKQIGNTCTETCNSCSVIFHFSVIHPKDQCRTENLSLFQIDDQVNQICPYIFKVYHLFGKYLVEVRKRPEDLTFLSTT